MPWTPFRDQRGNPWSVNQTGLWMLVRQHVYNKLLYQRSREVRENRLFLPDLLSVETDFNGIREARDRESAPLWTDIEHRVSNDPAGALPMLVQMRERTEHYAGELIAMQRRASRETFANIERSVAAGERGRAIAAGVVELSATTLVVGSAFLTGGAAVAVLGGGSVLKGTGRYQETGNIGGAILEATGTFVVGVIPLAGGSLQGATGVSTALSQQVATTAARQATVRTSEAVALVIVGAGVDAQVEGLKALVDGRSASDALRAAAVRFTVDVTTGGFGAMLDKRAMQVGVRLVADSLASTTGDWAVGQATAPPARGARSHTSQLPAPSAPLCDANAVLSTGSCDAAEWVRQIALRPGG